MRPRSADRWRARWGKCRWTVMYAATEWGLIARGRCLDGWFGTADLVGPWIGWRVADGELLLRREGGEVRTGDRAEGEGERFRVLGRLGAVANVGGGKVDLVEVEQVAMACAGVEWAMAKALRNGVTGEVVGLRYWPAPGEDAAEVQRRLEQWSRARLPKPAWPRVWEVGAPQLGPNAKGRA